MRAVGRGLWGWWLTECRESVHAEDVWTDLGEGALRQAGYEEMAGGRRAERRAAAAATAAAPAQRDQVARGEQAGLVEGVQGEAGQETAAARGSGAELRGWRRVREGIRMRVRSARMLLHRSN